MPATKTTQKKTKKLADSHDEIQNAVSAVTAIKDRHRRRLAIEQIFQLTEAQEIEEELNEQADEAVKWFDKVPGNENMSSFHYFVQGDIRRYDVQKRIQEVTPEVDLIFTSPPYNANIKYDEWDDNLSLQDYSQFLSESINTSDELLKPGGRFVINIRDLTLGTGRRHPIIVLLYEMLCKKRNYDYRGVHIWYKGREESSFAWGSYKSSQNPAIIDLYEYVFVFQKRGERTKGNDDIQKTDFIESVIGVWKIRPVKKIIGKSKTNTAQHPCPFPPELARRVIKLYTQCGDTVLDPFAGVGSTAVGAVKAGRNSISVDISPAYCDVGYRRLKREFRDLWQIADTLQIGIL
jgi:site-specific DNA-methyltransferase (adenine-specific)